MPAAAPGLAVTGLTAAGAGLTAAGAGLTAAGAGNGLAGGGVCTPCGSICNGFAGSTASLVSSLMRISSTLSA
jgi:hypothetical protein